tara:strand:+ start:4753 stop:4857 length:105 start_codon:yes stop_codon:yes gene_type:complete
MGLQKLNIGLNYCVKTIKKDISEKINDVSGKPSL